VSTSIQQVAENKRLDQHRLRGHRGGMISMHRALGHFHLGPINLMVAIALFVSFSALWLLLLPKVCDFWRWIFAAGLRYLPLAARLDVIHREMGLLHIAIPCLRMTPVLPGFQTWLLNSLFTAGLFAATFLLPKHLVPVIYLSRALLLIHSTACIYFVVWPSQFPHTPDSYLQGLMLSSIAIVTVVPLVLGLTYYIFDFGIWRKAFLTSLTMAYLVLFIPFQVLFQAIFLQETVLYMPVMYIIFGMPADVLLIVCFYSWGMTWSFRENQG
jgi:hypothetical protein